MVLKVKSPSAPGLKLSTRRSNGEYMLWKDFGNRLEFQNESLHALASETEALANIPVVDETSVTNHFDFDLNCSQTDLESRDLDSLNQALDPLGLELIPTNMPIKMLVVEKAP